MSVLKSLDINLPQSEKRTLINFLSLYIFFIVVIFGFTITLYYGVQEDLMKQNKKLLLNDYADDFIVQIEKQNMLHKDYPHDKGFHSAIYDKNYQLIHATIKNPKRSLDQIIYNENRAIRYLKNPNAYYKGTQYILIEIDDDKKWFERRVQTIVVFGTVAFVFMLVMGYFLLKLLLKPMRDALHLLDRFIKDTTHELNTPVSTIITNIEMIEIEKLEDKKLAKKMSRIDIGAKTISNIYDDLTYLILNNKIVSQNRDLDFKKIIEQRVDYFKTLANAKKISIINELKEGVVLYSDEKKISKLLDNLISNAIKYNRVGGSIHVVLTADSLTIEDSGKGISRENINLIFERYTRFDKSVGGFGIGLNIVKLICDEYNFKISISSELEKYTKIQIRW